MSDYITGVEQLAKDNIETFKSKNKEYGNAFQESVEKYGMIAALTRMSDKFKRIEHLILSDDDVVHESLVDNLLDISNYALMSAYEVLKKDSKKDTN